MVRGLVGPTNTNTNTNHRPPTFQCEAMHVSAKPVQGGCVGHQVKKTKFSILVKWRLDLIKETEIVFDNFQGKDVRSGSFTVEPF